MTISDQDSLYDQTEYSARTPDYYLNKMDLAVHDSFTPEQLAAVRNALQSAMPAPSPKIVDLRVNIDLIMSRFYIVLFVGKDRRKKKRKYSASGITVIANRIAAIGLLVGLNITISLFFFLVAYLLKSALGINLFAGHLSDYLKH
jgi:hypothetical protein